MTREELLKLRAAGVITEKEMDVLELAHRMSDRTIALALGISRSAARDRRQNAQRKIRLHLGEAA